jgi:hypothetical protein
MKFKENMNKTENLEPFTTEYLYNEIATFYDLMGYKDNWKDPEKLELGIKAIFFQYTHLKDFDKDKNMNIHIDALMLEYDKRKELIFKKEFHEI